MTLAHNVSELLKSAPGSSRRVNVEEPDAHLGPDLHLASPVRGTMQLLRTQNGVLARARLTTSVELECARCLEPVQREAIIDLEEEFRPSIHITTGAPLEPPEDEALRIDEQHVLDLTEAARQYVEASLPLQVLCSPSCRGLCPVCGNNLNQESCTCEMEPAAATGPFAALARLMDNNEEPQPRAG